MSMLVEEINALNIADIYSQVLEHLKQNSTFELDLAKIGKLELNAIQLLLTIQKDLLSQEKQFVLLNVGDETRQSFEIYNVDKRLLS